MACSKVVIREKTNSSITWRIENPSALGIWNFEISRDVYCNACGCIKPEGLDFRWNNGKSRFCLDCLEYVLAMTAHNTKEYIDMLMRLNKNERTTAKLEYKRLKVEHEELKLERAALAPTETTAAPIKIPLVPMIKKRSADKKQFGWAFDGRTSSLCTKEEGSCKSCAKSGIVSVFIDTQESRVSFCIHCIRSFFDEMKPNKEELDKKMNELQKEVASAQKEVASKQKEIEAKQKELAAMQEVILLLKK